MPEDTALCLYRIAQEALNNAVRHSGRTAARVELAREGSELRLVIADDGVGFDPETMCANGSLGLVSMGERARFVNGRLSVESHAGKGTRVEVRVPIKRISPNWLRVTSSGNYPPDRKTAISVLMSW